MRKFFSVFMALTVSAGLCFSTVYAEAQRIYRENEYLLEKQKYQEHSAVQSAKLATTANTEQFSPSGPVVSAGKFSPAPDIILIQPIWDTSGREYDPTIIDRIPGTLNEPKAPLPRLALRNTDRTTAVRMAAYKAPGFLDDS